MQAEAMNDPRPQIDATGLELVYSGNCQSIQRNGGLQSLVTALKEHGMIPLPFCRSLDKFRSLFQNDKDHPEAIEQQLDLRAADTEGRTALHFAVRYIIRSEDEDEMQMLQRLIIMYASHGELTVRPKSTFLHEAARVGNQYVLTELRKVYQGTPSCISHDCLQELLSGPDDGYSPAVEALFSHSSGNSPPSDEAKKVRFVEEIVNMADELIQKDFLKEVKLESIHRRLMEESQIRNQLSRELRPTAIYEEVEEFTRAMPLYAALYAGQEGVFDLLLASGIVSVDQPDHWYRRTCLHWAVWHKRQDILGKLLKSDGIPLNPGMRDGYYESALELARDTNNNDAMSIFMGTPAFVEYLKLQERLKQLEIRKFSSLFVLLSIIVSGALENMLQLQSQDLFGVKSTQSIFVMLLCLSLCTAFWGISIILMLAVRSLRNPQINAYGLRCVRSLFSISLFTSMMCSGLTVFANDDGAVIPTKLLSRWLPMVLASVACILYTRMLISGVSFVFTYLMGYVFFYRPTWLQRIPFYLRLRLKSWIRSYININCGFYSQLLFADEFKYVSIDLTQNVKSKHNNPTMNVTDSVDLQTYDGQQQQFADINTSGLDIVQQLLT